MNDRLNNIKLILSYDGSRYHGWQRQKGDLTVQEVMEDRIRVMCEGPVTVIGSGRTDAGVHAVGQTCNFMTHSNILPDVLRKGLNSLLPDDIFVKDADYVPLEFHARYSARSKVYEYRILNRQEPDVFQRKYVWHIRNPLDTVQMARCLAHLKGTHDFSSFKSSGSRNQNPVRSVTMVGFRGSCGEILRLVIEADGFLRHMVRNVVGTLVEVGLGKIDFKSFGEILESRDRRLAGVKAPAQGLFLMKVRY